jgi:hypothetical protein
MLWKHKRFYNARYLIADIKPAEAPGGASSSGAQQSFEELLKAPGIRCCYTYLPTYPPTSFTAALLLTPRSSSHTPAYPCGPLARA